VTVAHVAKPRLPLEDGRFYRETVDHTDLNDDIRAGRIVREQAAELASRNIINRALGVDSVSKSRSIHPRPRRRPVLLCSDGIYRHCPTKRSPRVV